MKPSIRIIDNQFAHTPGGSFGAGDLCIPPTFFDWYRGNEIINDVVVVTEGCFHLVDRLREKIKIALIIEPPLINSGAYDWIRKRENYSRFDCVFTYNVDLMGIDTRFIWYPFGGCWIRPEDQKIYDKTKGISIIASGKRITHGHRLRHEVIERLAGKIDVFGNGYKYVENKIQALKDYRYSIVIENDPCPGFFSEKLVDCFRTGTLPIFWGDTRSVTDCFSIDGICFFKDVDDLVKNIDIWDEQYYDHRNVAISSNFNHGSVVVIPEDWLWEHYFKTIIKS